MNETNSPRRLVRSRDDRFIGGVAAGIANYFNLDPVLIRVAFVISIAFGGIGVLAYVALLVMVPVDGDPAEPIKQPTGLKRGLVIGGTIVLGCLALASIDGAGFGGWFFGIGPGPLFGILIWALAIAGVVWLIREATRGDNATTGAFGRSPESKLPVGATADTGTETEVLADNANEVTTTMASSPTQNAPTEAMPLNPSSPTTRPPAAPQGSSAGSQAGRIMMWIAIGISAMIVFTILAVISAWTTVIAGSIPMAAVVILLGGGLIFAAVRGRKQLAAWMLATALVIAIPMAFIAIADIRIEGGYGEFIETPTVANDIPVDGYKMAAGATTIDLRKFNFKAGEPLELDVNSGFGATRMIIPDDVCVIGVVSGKAGLADIRGNEVSGVKFDRRFLRGAEGILAVELSAEFQVGYFAVVDETDWNFDFGAGEQRDYDDWDGGRADNSKEEAAARQRAINACSGPAGGEEQIDGDSGSKPDSSPQKATKS